MEEWPFDQQPNAAAIMLRAVVERGAAILRVSNDEEDHGWQFLTGGDADIDDAAVVSMAYILRLDPTVREVADLPPGWRAHRRIPGEPWTREPKPRGRRCP